MTYKAARQYIEQRKAEKFAGYDDWRLPTVEELCSLVEKERNSNGLFIDRRFDQTQIWMWSADIRQIKDESSAQSAWGVNFRYGLVRWYLLNYYVRCVRSGQ